VWASPEFEAELARWCRSVLGTDVRLEVTMIRCWSAVWRVLAENGTYYAKQNCPGQAFEAALMDVLASLSDRVVPVTAVELGQGFLMTPDQGPVMREAIGDNVETWCAVVREAALLQREVAGHVAALELVGARRLGAAEAATYVVTRLQQYAALPEGDRRRVDAAAAARLRSVLPDLERWVDQVLALGLPVTLNHSDLHSNNVFALESGMRFFDFGDSVLSDPLSVLLATLNSMKFHLDCAPGDPRLVRVADAAIEVWSDLAPTTQLRAALGPSLQLAKLARSESWARCLTNLTDEEMGEFGDSAAWWLVGIAEPPPLGTC
jgi:Phosphotransferase enzyme family